MFLLKNRKKQNYVTDILLNSFCCSENGSNFQNSQGLFLCIDSDPKRICRRFYKETFRFWNILVYEYSFLVRHQYYHLFKICFSTVLYRLGNLSWSLIHCTVHISQIFRCFTVQCTLYIPKLCRFLDLQQPVPKCILTSALKHGAKAWQNLWSSNVHAVWAFFPNMYLGMFCAIFESLGMPYIGCRTAYFCSRIKIRKINSKSRRPEMVPNMCTVSVEGEKKR